MGETRYARSGDLHIAYQVLGDGPTSLVYVPGFVSHVELFQEEPAIAPHLRRLASFSRLVLFDKRGTGMSDPWHGAPTLDDRMDDIRAVMDDAGVGRAAVLGVSEGAPLAVMFAATHPHRVSSLILFGGAARFTRTGDYPIGPSLEEAEPWIAASERTWGDPHGAAIAVSAPSMAGDARFRESFARARRRAASPRMAADLLRLNLQVDVRAVLPAVSVPTLVLHRAGDRFVSVEHGRYLGSHIPGARYIELEGDDHVPFGGDQGWLEEVEEFVTGARTTADADRVLATVLFTDIVGSTERAAAEGDRRWRERLDAHDEVTRRQVERFGGRAIKSTGDGFLSVFDRPGRAIDAASAVVTAVADGGLDVRAGLHTGEVELRGDDIGGLSVHIGARVAALAGPREVLVSRTVKDLVVGSASWRFEDRGVHRLKGVPGEWELYGVSP